MRDSSNGQPFSSAVKELRDRGLRYSDLERKAQRARSTAWFNKLVNDGPSAVSPPTGDAIEGFAALLQKPPDRIREMIAEEWYGVKVADLSPRVRDLASRIDDLDPSDARLLGNILQRLHSSREARR